MTKIGLAKAVLAFTGIAVFLWARDDDQQLIRWIAIGLMVTAFMLRFVERRSEERGANIE